MKLFIKNMISYTSVNEVKSLLRNFGLQPVDVSLGELIIEGHISYKTYSHIDEALRRKDFELINDKQLILLEKIQNAVVEMIFFSESLPMVKYSSYLSKKLEMNYAYLSRFFSDVKKITIEKFIITKKIERAKQLLMFDELSVTEIASRLQYSSTNHLCAQFKKFTGFSPSQFKKTAA